MSSHRLRRSVIDGGVSFVAPTNEPRIALPALENGVDAAAIDWRRGARCGAVSLMFNVTLLVILAFVTFDRESAKPRLVLQLRLLKEAEPAVVVEPPLVAVAAVQPVEPLTETPIIAKDDLRAVRQYAKVALPKKLAAILDGIPKLLSRPTPPPKLAGASRTKAAGDAGGRDDDWTGWSSFEIAEGQGSDGIRQTIFFGIPAFAQRIVYVVDASGSMRGERFAQARAELLGSVGQLGSLQSIAVFFFNDHRNTRVYPRPGKMAAASEQKKTEVQLWAEVIRPRGYTHPTRFLRQALKLRPDVIFFLSDGEIPENTVCVAKEDNESGETIIHTICFQNVEGHDLLRRMAEENGGDFRFVE